MQAEQFLDRLEHHGLLDDDVIQDLREQVRASQGRATPDAIAKLLVENGYLTQLQANKIMDELAAAPAAPQPTAPTQPQEEIVALEEATPPSPPPAPAAASGLTELPASSGLTELPANTGLDPLGGLGGDPLAGDLGGSALGGPATNTGTPTMAPVKRFGRQGNKWDSKYLLIGGAALLLICLVGFFLFNSLTAGNAAEYFKQAEQSYTDENYPQAIEEYAKFIKRFPKDENISKAKVKQGMCRLRIAITNSSDPNQGMTTAKEILPTIETEDAFNDVRVELADLLPQLAEKYIDAAEQASGDQAKELVAQTQTCMKELVGNPVYIPSKLMRNIDTRLEPIRERIIKVERGILRDSDLGKAIATVASALESGNTRGANDIIKNTIDKHPELELHPSIIKAAQDVAAKERELVKVEDKAVDATTEDRSESVGVVPSSTTGKKISELENQVGFIRAKGAAYGLDLGTGKVLWRRYIGNDANAFDPVKVGAETDALLIDHQNNDVLRVNGRTGKLVWRLAVGEAIASSSSDENRILVATRSGRILQLDPKTGNSKKSVVLPMNVSVSPTLSERRPQIYQIGDHSNLYVLDNDTLKCNEVLYIGHKQGTVNVTPQLHLGHLFVCENRGEDFSLVRVYATDRKGLNLKPTGEPIRLPGKVVVPPTKYRRRVLVVTDLGHLRLLKIEVDKEGNSKVMTMFALPQRQQPPTVGYPLAFQGKLWLGDSRLTQFQVQLARARFQESWTRYRGDSFVAPLQKFGNVILHVRQPRGSTGVAVSTIVPESGEKIWETRLAVPGNVRVSPSGSIEAISAAGDLYSLGNQPNAGVATPSHSTKNKAKAAFTDLVDLGDGRVVATPSVNARQFVLYSPQGPDKMKLVELAIAGTSAAPPVAFAKGLLFPMSTGQIFLIDPATGKQMAFPFQPALSATEYYHWSRPVSLPGNEVLISNKSGQLFVLTLRQEAPRHLGQVVMKESKIPLYRPITALGDVVFLVKRALGHDEIITLKRNEAAENGFVEGKKFTLKGRVAWGPVKVANQILVAGDMDGLVSFDDTKQLWTTSLNGKHLAGHPIKQNSDLLLTLTDGTVRRISGETGRAIGTPVKLNEPIGQGGALLANQLVLCGVDGVIHWLPVPKASQSGRVLRRRAEQFATR